LIQLLAKETAPSVAQSEPGNLHGARALHFLPKLMQISRTAAHYLLQLSIMLRIR